MNLGAWTMLYEVRLRPMLHSIGPMNSATSPTNQGPANSQPCRFSTRTRRLTTRLLLALLEQRCDLLGDLVEPLVDRHLVDEDVVVQDPDRRLEQRGLSQVWRGRVRIGVGVGLDDRLVV